MDEEALDFAALLKLLTGSMPEETKASLYQAVEGDDGWGPLVGLGAKIHNGLHTTHDGKVFTITHDFHPRGIPIISASPEPGVKMPLAFMDGEYDVVHTSWKGCC
jgi:hypothetical protein